MAVVTFGVNLAIACGAVVLVFGVTLVVTVLRCRHDTVDTSWGLGFVAVAAVGCVLAPDAWRAWLVFALTTVWGLRLAVHVHRRNLARGEDPRYTDIAARAGTHPYRRLLLVIYPVQAVAMWLVSTPIQAAAHVTGSFGAIDAAGVAVWLLGLIFETVGDVQLARFTAAEGGRGSVLDRGLWRYSRHPNYFGDACVWWGLYLLACHEWLGVATIVGPIVMTYLLARGTGKPLTERHLIDSRPGYAAYVRRTSGFVPLPPRSRHSR